jgi:hypothetical protein
MLQVYYFSALIVYSDLHLQIRYVVSIRFEIVFWFLVGADVVSDFGY